VADDTYDVFVSYSRADGRHAAEIDSVLRDKGLKTFFDRRNLAAGLPWVRALGAGYRRGQGRDRADRSQPIPSNMTG
jgi:TIR domain